MTATASLQSCVADTVPVPDGWQALLLGQIAEIIAGQSPPGSTYRTQPEGLPFFQGKADFGVLHPVPRVWCVEPGKIAKPGDILISVRAPVGPTNVADRECCIGRGLAAIRCKSDVDRDFVLAYLRHIEPSLTKSGSGSTFGAINRDALEDIVVPLPSKAEQKRIAGVLRERFRSIEHARNAAQEQRTLTSSLAAVFFRQECERGEWPIRSLGEGILGIEAGTSVLSLERPKKDGEWGVLKVSAVSWGRFRPEENKAVPPDYTPSQRETVQAGDFLISRCNTAELAGAVVIVRGLPTRLMLSDKTLRLVLKSDVYAPDFLELALRTRIAREFIECNATGTSYSMRNISQDTIRAIPVPTPPIDQQRHIAARLREIEKLAEVTTRGTVEQLNAINSLPTALLREAFSGRL